MKTSTALKLGGLAIAALGLLSGCFLFQNTATITFENNGGPESLVCYFDDEIYGTVDVGFWISSDYTWSGDSSKYVGWEAYRESNGLWYASGTELVRDGEGTTIVF